MDSFRRAAISDYWKTANKRKFPCMLKSLSVNSNSTLKGLNINFGDGVQAICGHNGVGKSTIIRKLFNEINNEDLIECRKKFKDPILDSILMDIEINKSGDVCAFLFDPCYLVPTIQSFTKKILSIDDILEQEGVFKCSNGFKKRISYLTGINYSSIEECIISDVFPDFDFKSIPYFKVSRSGGVSYTSTEMGMGEFSLFYFCYLLEVIDSSECENKILFIEEPESFLPPAAQEKLMNMVAYYSYKGLQVIICSHSDAVLNKINRSNLHLIQNIESEFRAIKIINNFNQFKTLGLRAKTLGAIFCEDDFAELLIREIVSSSDLFVEDNFVYHAIGSNGDIQKCIKNLPGYIDDLIFIGCFDGDCRDSFNVSDIEDKNFCFLPKEVAPEKLIIEHVENLSLNNLASILGVDISSVCIATESAIGADHHDYFDLFFDTLNMEKKEGQKRLIRNYLSNVNEPTINLLHKSLIRFKEKKR